MRFQPGAVVALFTDDGTEVLAKPFFFTGGGSRELSVRFYTAKGEPIRCIDEGAGIFEFEQTGQRLSLKAPSGFS